jgi:hypothetical protein
MQITAGAAFTGTTIGIRSGVSVSRIAGARDSQPGPLPAITQGKRKSLITLFLHGTLDIGITAPLSRTATILNGKAAARGTINGYNPAI